MILKFWLLDVWSRVESGTETAHLVGFNEDNELIELVDGSVRPFLIAEKFHPGVLRGTNASIVEVKKVEGLVEKTFMKVSGYDATKDIPSYRGILLQEDVRVFESDIYYTQVYMKERGFKPCSWHLITNVEKLEKYRNKFDLEGYKCLRIDKSKVAAIDDDTVPQIRPMALDIESYNPRGGMPNVDKDPIIVFGLRVGAAGAAASAARASGARSSSSFAFQRELKDTSLALGDEVRMRWKLDSEDDDGQLLHRAISDILFANPTLIATYNGNEFDWGYIDSRSEVTGVPFEIGLDGSRPHKTEFNTVAINGRPTIDLFGIAKFVVPKGSRKTQPIVHAELAKAGLVPKRKFYEINRDQIAKMWDNPKTREDVIKHCESDVEFTMDIFNYAWPFLVELCKMTRLPPDEALSVTYSILVEGFLMDVAKEMNILIPNAEYRAQGDTSGAVCFAPKKGVIENVAVFDFKGMYPNILIENNISPETFVGTGNMPGCNCIETDRGERFLFLKEPDGFFKVSMQRLNEAVEYAKKKFSGRKYKQKYAGEVQALKTVARSMYGYLKAPKTRWFLQQAQEAVASEGRNRVNKAKEKAEEYGYEVVYGDTDSIFLTGLTIEDCEEFAKVLSEEVGAEVDFDKFYKVIFFTDAKKIYAGLTSEGEVDYVGFVKSDWSGLANKAQKKELDLILREKDPEKAKEVVKWVAKGIDDEALPLKDFIIWKRLRRELSSYKHSPPHVAVALRNPESFVEEDGTVGFIVTKGKKGQRIWERAKHYTEIKDISEVDKRYYKRKQLGAVSNRILKYFTGGGDFINEYFKF